ncbi:MAG TPA: hypothetical protein VK879_15020 [Candidatus Sulfomarinibacteraceae bacterium]|nr:hypothetical protein [Candidatus Sulfomarinibacteraceae bacterium]
MQKRAAIALIIGSIMFMGSVFLPAIYGQFQATTPDEIVALIEGDRAGWLLAQILFHAGPIIAATGLVLLARHMQRLTENDTVQLLAYAGAALVFIASLGMLYNFYRLVTYPAEAIAAEVISGDDSGSFLFSIYTALTHSGLLAMGVALLKTGYPKLLAFFVLGVMALAFLSFVLAGDTLPLYQYFVMTILGSALLFARSRAAATQIAMSPSVSE